MCLVLHHRNAVQFFFYLPILVMFMSLLCSVMFSFLHLPIILLMIVSALCSVVFSFFVFVNFSNVHVCFAFRHVHFFVFANFVNVIQVYLNGKVFLFVFVFIGCVFILWYFVFQVFFVFFQILVMFFKCILICECTCLFLSSL